MKLKSVLIEEAQLMSVQQWANLKCESLQWTQAARGGAIKHMVATHKLPHQRHH